MINPIVIFLFYIGFAFSAILNNSWLSLSYFYVFCLILLLLNIKYMKNVFRQIKPFFIFFPILITIYLLISIIFTRSPWSIIINNAGLAIAKLFLLVIVMALYLEISKKHNLILAMRSIWSRLNKKWRWVEDIFMYLELTLRFYPTFQREWQLIGRSKKAIGLSMEDGKWERVKSVADDLPGMILQSYRKAENTATVMQQRGYGNIIPRGVANAVIFKTSDIFLILLIIFSYGIIYRYVTL